MKENFKKILVIIFSLLITLLFGEILLQVVYRVQNHAWVWEENAFKVSYLVPVDGRRKYTLRADYYDREQNMPINARGERETLQPLSLGESDGIIVCLGDSVPFGAGIGNDATYPYFLAQTLSNDGLRYYVINAGVPSYNYLQSFDRLENEVMQNVNKEKIRVVTLQAANDISLFLYYRENWAPDITWADVRFNIKPFPFSNFSAISYYLSQLISQPKGVDKEFSADLMLETLEHTLTSELENLFNIKNDLVVVLLPVNPFYYQTKNIKNR